MASTMGNVNHIRRCVLAVLLIIHCQDGFLVRNQHQHRVQRGSYLPTVFTSYTSNMQLYSSTPQYPLYDGTNYTFPDTTTPDGIAAALEVSFVHACMQISSGYVDILKLFIATAVSSYKLGFPIDVIQEALLECPNDTANRPLVPEEVNLRYTWYSLVYLTLLTIDYPTIKKETVSDSIPVEIRETYGSLVNRLSELYKADETPTISVADLIKEDSAAAATATAATTTEHVSQMDKAILLQSMRVASLTLVVLRESLEAGPTGQTLPRPPIPGAFDQAPNV